MRGGEALDDHILLGFLSLVLPLKVQRIVLLCLLSWIDLGQIGVHVFLSEVNVLQEALPALLHLYQARLEPLPEFVVRCPAHITRVPYVMLDELLDLVLPLWFQHYFFNGLHGNH